MIAATKAVQARDRGSQMVRIPVRQLTDDLYQIRARPVPFS